VSERAERLAGGLWRWTAPHPLWRPGMDDDPGGWPQDVASVVHERAGVVTIVDPLAGAEDAPLWAFLDERCAGAQRVVVAVTASWHRRSAGEVADRYDAEIRAHRIAAADAELQGLDRLRAFDEDGEIAPGVEALLVGGLRQGEVVYWLPGHGALVAAEVLQGRPDGLRVGEDPAMASREALYAWVRGLDRLPITLVLPTHGPPASGPDAVREALARPPWRPRPPSA
jgi:glyoxylase-like metal-dependent hydrolase (beta-lactamase superfamily II)